MTRDELVAEALRRCEGTVSEESLREYIREERKRLDAVERLLDGDMEAWTKYVVEFAAAKIKARRQA